MGAPRLGYRCPVAWTVVELPSIADMGDIGELAQYSGHRIRALCVITWNQDTLTVNPNTISAGFEKDMVMSTRVAVHDAHVPMDGEAMQVSTSWLVDQAVWLYGEVARRGGVVGGRWRGRMLVFGSGEDGVDLVEQFTRRRQSGKW